MSFGLEVYKNNGDIAFSSDTEVLKLDRVIQINNTINLQRITIRSTDFVYSRITSGLGSEKFAPILYRESPTTLVVQQPFYVLTFGGMRYYPISNRLDIEIIVLSRNL